MYMWRSADTRGRFAGGELFSQRFEGYTLHVTALFEQVVVSWARPQQQHREVGLPKETLDNRWHWVALRYKPNPPSLLLEVDRDTQVSAHICLASPHRTHTYLLYHQLGQSLIQLFIWNESQSGWFICFTQLVFQTNSFFLTFEWFAFWWFKAVPLKMKLRILLYSIQDITWPKPLQLLFSP